MKHLIVTADDVGMNHALCAGALRVADEGIVTSMALVVGAPASAAAFALVAARPALSVGLQLRFVRGKPLAHVPGLLEADGCLPVDVLALARRRAPPSELAREAEAQLAAFVAAFGRSPDFLATHQNTQLLPSVRGAVLDLAVTAGIPAVRYPVQHRLLRPTAKARTWLWPLATALGVAGRPALARSGLRHPDRMLAAAEPGRLSRRELDDLLAKVTEGTTELVTWPSAANEDVRSLTAPGLAERLAAAGVRLVGYP